MKGKYKDMEELERQENSRQERIAKAEKDLANAELELENLPPFEPPRDKVVCHTSFTELFIFLSKNSCY